MENIIAISRCLVQGKNSTFHFKGYYYGEKIELIVIREGPEFVVGEAYLLYLRVRGISGGSLYCSCQKFEKIWGANLQF